MAREFQRSLDDMAREAELQDLKAEMDKLKGTDVRQRLEKTIDPDRSLRAGLEPPKDEPKSPAAPAPAGPAEALPPPEPAATAEPAPAPLVAEKS